MYHLGYRDAMAETRFGTFDELIADRSPEVRAIAAQLRASILEIDPEAVEVVRLGDNAATYGIGPKKMSEGYVYVMPLSDRVNLGFYHGVALADPEQLLEGTGRAMRHVKVSDLERLDAMMDLVDAARNERIETLQGG